MTAQESNDRGQEALAAERYEDAVRFFSQAAAEAPDWSVPLYNLGLTYKNTKDWQECRDANLAAFRLDPEDEATIWNLAISAVAISDWDSAGQAFQAIGLQLPDGPPPWDFQLGLVPIRLSPDDYPEVVWCHRLDPVRGKVANVPFPDCGRRFGDIVLNDGEPRGYRRYRGKEVPVFNELKLLEPSDYSTFQALLHVKNPATLDGLMGRFEEHMMEAENWTESVRMLCRACSEGVPHEEHDEELQEESLDDVIRLGIAATQEQEVRRILEEWPGGQILRLEKVL